MDEIKHGEKGALLTVAEVCHGRRKGGCRQAGAAACIVGSEHRAAMVALMRGGRSAQAQGSDPHELRRSNSDT